MITFKNQKTEDMHNIYYIQIFLGRTVFSEPCLKEKQFKL